MLWKRGCVLGLFRYVALALGVVALLTSLVVILHSVLKRSYIVPIPKPKDTRTKADMWRF